MADTTPERIVRIEVDKIEKHPEVPNVRSKINKADVKDLVDSIREKGVRTPITVFKQVDEDGKEHIYYVSGERRIRAIQQLTKEEPDKFDGTIPAIFREYSDTKQALFDNLIENIQRQDVNPVDLANRIKMLLEKGYNKSDIGKEIGKSVVWVSEALSFIEKADDAVKEQVKDGSMTFDEGKKLSKLSSKEKQKIIAEGLAEAKEKGDKKALKQIKKALEEKVRVRSSVAPQKKELTKAKELVFVVLKEMKKQKKNESEPKKYAGIEGILLGLKFAVGEEQSLKLAKICKDLGIDPDTGDLVKNKEEEDSDE